MIVKIDLNVLYNELLEITQCKDITEMIETSTYSFGILDALENCFNIESLLYKAEKKKKDKTMLNHHLKKSGPLYRVINREYTVKLLKVLSTIDGLSFTAEIVGGNDSGKWTTVRKSELSRIRGNNGRMQY